MTPHRATAVSPPRHAAWLLERLMPLDRQNETIRGDLLEEFRRRHAAFGARSSCFWYWREALSLIVRGQGYKNMLTLDNLRQDLRFAWRSLRKAPGFTAIVITTLAIGIGASTAIFSAVDAILLKPLPFSEPDRLLWINEVTPQGIAMSVSWPDYLDWRTRVHGFDALAASRTNSFTWTGTGEARRLDGRRVTSNFFAALGVQPATGRAFVEHDDDPGAQPVAVVTYEFWQRRLDGDRQVLGRTLALDAQPFTIVGVLPAGFRYLRDYDLFVAMGPFLGDQALRERGNHAGYIALGRLKRGVSREAATRELQAVEADLAREHADVMSGVTASVEPLSSRLVAPVRQTLWLLFGAVGVLLLIACVNVASLLIARGAARQHELAVRSALGGRRLRIATQLLVESMLLSAIGGGLGVLLASALLRVLLAFAPEATPRIDEVHLDTAALLFALAAAAACGIVFGAFPAAQASGVTGQQALIRTRAAGASAASSGLRRGLLAVEVALALILLTGAGLMIRTLRGLTTEDAGFRPDHLLTLRVSTPGERWTPARRVTFVDQMIARTRALPGVSSAAANSALPIDGSDWNSVFAGEGKPSPARRDELPSAAMTLVTPAYFEAMGTRLVRGRTFTSADRADARPVAIVNESLARQIWPGEDAIGKRLKQGWPEQPGTWREIVGIVADVKFEGVTERTPLQVYMPFAQDPPRAFFIIARTATDPASLASAIEATVHSFDRDLPVFAVRTMERVMESEIERQRTMEIVLSVFAIVALLLASIGLYGIVAHSVTERTHEIGVRMALGAERGDVLRLVVRHGLSMTLVGLAIGVAGAAAVTGSLRGLLYGVQPFDLLTFVAVAALLVLTASVACLIPAARALQIPPTTALRSE
jgi:putative ABC transport system permease protein